MLVLYDKDSQEFDSLGIGVLRDLRSDPLITEVLNGLYNLEFDYVKEGWLSEYLVEGNIIKADGQLFRIRNVEKDIKDTKITILSLFFLYILPYNLIKIIDKIVVIDVIIPKLILVLNALNISIVFNISSAPLSFIPIKNSTILILLIWLLFFNFLNVLSISNLG